MPVVEENYDVVVVGAGHAGCEAALASARLGLETILFTVSMDSVAMMPCNPNVGGSSKGHLVREMDALGGEMGKNIDKTYIQSKMLNASKGPAVHSLRAQADKSNYSRTMKHTLENTDHLVLRQAEVSELMVTDGVVKGVKTFSGATYYAKAVVLCTGTYLKARCIYGDVVNHTGPNGLMAANHLSDSMKEAGIGIAGLRQVHLQDWIRERSISLRWRNKRVMSISFHFHLQIQKKISRGIRYPAGFVIQMRKHMRSFVRISTVLHCFPV